jgi:hypothetical protein
MFFLIFLEFRSDECLTPLPVSSIIYLNGRGDEGCGSTAAHAFIMC